MLEILQKEKIGRIWTMGKPSLYPGEKWGFDSGVYGYFIRGEKMDWDTYRRRLDVAASLDSTPTINVVPDIVGDGSRSLEFSYKWADKMPQHWPNYLCLQDGMTGQEVTWIAEKFDGLFLGGTDKFKATAGYWRVMARRLRLPFHYGRAGTLKKIEAAQEIEADSLDSSFPLWTMERMKLFVDRLNQPRRRKLWE